MAAPSSSTPRFCVLIPTYNQANFLPQAVDSLKVQNVGDWEAVIVNDGSNDYTAHILQDLVAAEPRLRVHHPKNGGCAAALNTALHHARREGEPSRCWSMRWRPLFNLGLRTWIGFRRCLSRERVRGKRGAPRQRRLCRHTKRKRSKGLTRCGA